MILSHKGIPVFYTDQGKGKAIVLLHGFLENSTMWNPFVTALSKKNRIICIDLLGHGKTGCLGYVHTMELMAETVHTVLNYLNISKSTIIGHSMGGYVALAFAEIYENKVEGLCLMNSTASADNLERKKNRDRAIRAVKKNHRIVVKIAIPMLFSEKNRTVFTSKIEQLTQEALQISPQGIIAALEGMKIREDHTLIYKNANFPIQLIIGKQDPALEYAPLIEQTKNTKVHVVEFPDGHMSHIENKDDLIITLSSFVKMCN